MSFKSSTIVNQRLAVTLVVGMLLIGCGAPPAPPEVPSDPTPPAPAKPLSVAVIDDGAVAQAAALLRGEWNERSGASFDIANVSLAEANAALSSADVAIFPSFLLGELVEKQRIQPLRPAMLDDPAYEWKAIPPPLREREIVHGRIPYAFPLGSPPLLLACRSETAEQLLEGHSATNPIMWETLEAKLAASDVPAHGENGAAQVKWILAWEGTAPAHALLARAAASAWSRSRPDALFDSQTMTPRLMAPPYVEALQSLVNLSGGADESTARPANFAAAIQSLRSGGGMVSLGWPGVDRGLPLPEKSHDIRFLLLPGSLRRYHFGRQQWESLAEPSAPQLLGAAGRLIGVTRSTRNRVNAFRLASWLSNPQNQPPLTRDSSQSAWSRSMGRAATKGWLGAGDHETDARTMDAALADAQIDMMPRIPGGDRYLEALAIAVRRAVAGELSCEAALADASAQWTSITAELGVPQQAAAYRRQLGLEESAPP